MEKIESILSIVRACDAVHLATCGGGCDGQYPDVRHVMNAMNKNARDLNLFFLTSVGSPKYMQLSENPNSCLYYFNDENRHVVRLFGQMRFVNDAATRREHWDTSYAQYGYSGWDDEKLCLMQFVAHEYKFYIGNDLHTGKIE